jgi:hypothetical protein
MDRMHDACRAVVHQNEERNRTRKKPLEDPRRTPTVGYVKLPDDLGMLIAVADEQQEVVCPRMAGCCFGRDITSIRFQSR